jgi:hypothetical protein
MTDQPLPGNDWPEPCHSVAEAVDMARGLRHATPTAVVLWEPARYSYYEPVPNGDSRDLLVSGLLAQGWALLTGDPQTVDLPLLLG